MDREDPPARKRRLARERDFLRWRASQSHETLNRMRAADNEYHRRGREGGYQEERQKRLVFFSEYRERIHHQQSQDIGNPSLYFSESQVET
ncbi:hypothetical protein AVEN_210668-1 [Araneus ventricosus]|uniref:Uncharacterized protein n=1 Tax=Araneus ventricosus TaxID=182803 RepID=A0A4Y2TXR7_ARAVE|nr:hypothetical protein AVEN_210668-1 [Araneus ventricosus]